MMPAKLTSPRKQMLAQLVCACLLAQVGPAKAQSPGGTDSHDDSGPDVDPTQFVAVHAAVPSIPWGVRWSVGPEWQNGPRLVTGMGLRFALDLRHEFVLGSGWRALVSDRLEVTHSASGGHQSTNALRELHVTHTANSQWFFDVGRINIRSGVALGYNPTDWLRGNVLATPANQNPSSARENRLGAFMLRAQHVTDNASMHWAYAPQLTSEATATARAWGLNLARGNAAHSLQWRYTPRLSESTSLDVLALATKGSELEIGANATAVLSPSLMAHAEATLARRARWTEQGLFPSKRLTPRAALGLSWTHNSGATWSVEYQHAGDALPGAAWNHWRLQSDALSQQALGAYRGERARTQDPLVRSNWFARLQWNDIRKDGRFDIGVFARLNPYDHSQLWQVSGSWHISPTDSLRVMIWGVRGSEKTEFGGRQLRQYLWMGWEGYF